MIPLEELSKLPIRTTYSLGSGGTFQVNQSFTHNLRNYEYSEEFNRENWHELVLHGFLYQAQTFGEIGGIRGWNKKYFGGKFKSDNVPEEMEKLNGIVTASHIPLILPQGKETMDDLRETILPVKSKRSELELYPGITYLGHFVYVEPTDIERIKLIFNPREAVRFTNQAISNLACLPDERDKIGHLFTHFPTMDYREKEELPTYDD